MYYRIVKNPFIGKVVEFSNDKKSIPQYVSLDDETYSKIYEFGLSELMEGVLEIPHGKKDAEVKTFFDKLGWLNCN